MFEGIETADLRIWLVSAYCSLGGNPDVALYTSVASSWLFRQALRLLKSLGFAFPTILSVDQYLCNSPEWTTNDPDASGLTADG